jgi:predicted nucleic acid-binding protein
MILADTSAWLRALAGREPYAKGMDRLAHAEELLRHDLVYGELLIGDRGGRELLLAGYARLSPAPSVPHGLVVEMVRARRLYGRGVGWVDAHLLASAIEARARLYTADAALAAVARELGIAHPA